MADHDHSGEALQPNDTSKHLTSGERSENIAEQQGSSEQVKDMNAVCHQMGATVLDTEAGKSILQQDATAQMDEASTKPTLALMYLARSGFEPHTPEVLMEKILSSIRDRCARDNRPLKNIRGRTPDYFRINYDPDATDITSIQRHLSDHVLNQAFAESPDYEKLDVRICQPLINSNWAVLLKYKKLGSDHHKHAFDKIHPISWFSREEAIATVVESARSRCSKVDPESFLLTDPGYLVGADATWTPEELEHVREWSLYDTELGFGAKVRVCFERDDPTVEQYEELIERTMYQFRVKNKEAVYGPKQEAEYSANRRVRKRVLRHVERDQRRSLGD